MKKEKNHLIDTIESIDQIVLKANLYKVSGKLEEISKTLDDQGLVLDDNKIGLIQECLNQAKAYSSKPYEAMLLNKCEHVIRVLSNDEIISDELRTKMKNEDKSFEMYGRLVDLDNQIKVIEKQMEDALGKDKNRWDRLNVQKKGLQKEYAIRAKNYQNLNKGIANSNLAIVAKNAREDSEYILSQNALPDVEEFTENVEFMTGVSDEIDDISNKMDNVFSSNFGAGGDSDYEKALEEKKLSQNNDGLSLMDENQNPENKN